jgi:hypothetical protein
MVAEPRRRSAAERPNGFLATGPLRLRNVTIATDKQAQTRPYHIIAVPHSWVTAWRAGRFPLDGLRWVRCRSGPFWPRVRVLSKLFPRLFTVFESTCNVLAGLVPAAPGEKQLSRHQTAVFAP